jgi:IPT/TIG domain/S-layer homology domain
MRKLTILAWALATPLVAATFTVTNTSDSGAGSLRDAITQANANPGADTIAFNIPGAGVHTITPATDLPVIFDPVTIDGYSQPGAAPNTDPSGFDGTLLVEVSGAIAGQTWLNVSAGGSTVRGLVINRFHDAIVLNTSGNHIEGNFFGTDAGGTLALGNEQHAIVLNASDNVIGGTTPGARNVISASGSVAFFILSAGNVIQGNFIGTQKDGLSPLGNLQGVGFVGNGGANDNTVGGTGPGEANVIAFSEIRGVIGEASSGTGNSVRGNSIHDNGTLGIDWIPVGATANDPGDADAGMNNFQNFPILKSVEHSLAEGSGNTRIIGKLDSAPSTTYDLDFYSNSVCSNFPREFVEGETWIGTAQVTTDASGHADIDVDLPVGTEVGARITATATDPAGNTSEFSQRIIFSIAPTSGPGAGGTAFTVAGTDFANPSTIAVGGVAATGVVFTDDHTLQATMPALPPGIAHDVVVMTPDGTTGTLIKGWVADFLDVPGGHQFYSFVTTLVSNAITAGVGGGMYGVTQDTLRQQMAVFLLKAKHGLCYTPPPCQGDFADVPCPSTFANWIEALADEGISGGCGSGNFCPTNPVRRDQMAPFLLKAEHGSSYVPPVCTGLFDDVTCPSLFADWIEQLNAESITGGCGGANYCPLANANRGQMAVFVVKTFGLQ